MPEQQTQTTEPTVTQRSNGQLIIDDEGSGFVLHQPNMYDGEIEETNFSKDTTEAETPSAINETEGAETLDLSVFDELDGSNSGDAQTEEQATQEEEQTAPEFNKFSEDFKKYMGIDLKEAMTLVQELQSFKAQQTVAAQEVQLRNTWGVDQAEFNNRMTEVRAYASEVQKKNPELFTKLDNIEGVKLIWAKLEQQKGTKQTRQQVPQVQRSSQRQPANAQPRYEFTMSQLQKMSREEYASKANLITQAFAAGRVDTRR